MDGAVYVYVRNGSSWNQQTKWTGTCNDDECYSLGGSLALSGDTAVLGDPWGYTLATYAGVARVYVRTGSTWNLQADLVPDGSPEFEGFGAAIAIQGDRVLVGAPDHISPEPFKPGGAYVFRRAGTKWSQEALLEVDGLVGPGVVGQSLALAGGMAVLGVSSWANGAAIIFQKHGSAWNQEAILTHPNPDVMDDLFGCAVAMSGDTLVVGAGGEDSFNPDNGEWRSDHGAAYVYRVPYDLTALVESVNPSGNEVQVKASAEPGFSYDLERSFNLRDWTTLLTTNAPPNGLFLHTDPGPPQPSATYRLKRNTD